MKLLKQYVFLPQVKKKKKKKKPNNFGEHLNLKITILDISSTGILGSLSTKIDDAC
jgi:hypothetical protein